MLGLWYKSTDGCISFVCMFVCSFYQLHPPTLNRISSSHRVRRMNQMEQWTSWKNVEIQRNGIQNTFGFFICTFRFESQHVCICKHQQIFSFSHMCMHVQKYIEGKFMNVRQTIVYNIKPDKKLKQSTIVWL